jgi:hypothetical protein
VPRNLEFILQTAPVELTDLVQLRSGLRRTRLWSLISLPRYYTEFQWLLDFSCYSLLTYILSEVPPAW